MTLSQLDSAALGQTRVMLAGICFSHLALSWAGRSSMDSHTSGTWPLDVWSGDMSLPSSRFSKKLGSSSENRSLWGLGLQLGKHCSCHVIATQARYKTTAGSTTGGMRLSNPQDGPPPNTASSPLARAWRSQITHVLLVGTWCSHFGK